MENRESTLKKFEKYWTEVSDAGQLDFLYMIGSQIEEPIRKALEKGYTLKASINIAMTDLVHRFGKNATNNIDNNK